MVFEEAKDSVTSVLVSKDSGEGEVITGSVDGKLRRYDLRMGMIYVDIIAQPITSLSQTLDDRAILVSTLDSTIRLMDKATGGLLQSYKGHVNKDYRIRSTFAMVDSYVVSGSEDGKVYAWDILEGKNVVTLVHSAGDGDGEGEKKVVSALAVNDGRKEMATAGEDGSIAIWQAE